MGTPSLILCWALLGQAADPAVEPRYPLDEAPRQLQPAPAFPADDEPPPADQRPAEPARPADRYPPLDGPLEGDQSEQPARDVPGAGQSPSADRGAPSEEDNPPQRPASDQAGEDRLVPVTPRTTRDRASQLIREALQPPAIGSLPGQPLALVELLTRTVDRQQQIAATVAYWQLAAAVANYHHRLAEYQFLETVAATEGRVHPEGEAALRAALAAARARVHETELEAISAQHHLAGRLTLGESQALPLPADVPHVGTYRTLFDVLFADRPAPAQAWLIHRTLPVRLRELSQRAEAVEAAVDALEASVEAFEGHEVGVQTVLDCLALVQEQRLAFVAAVEGYNTDIAHYALGIAPLGMPQHELAGMLIKPHDGGSGLVPRPDAAFSEPGGRVEQAGYNEPQWTAPRSAPTTATPNTPADSASPSRNRGEPTLAEPRLLPQFEGNAIPNGQSAPARSGTPEQTTPAAEEPAIRIRDPFDRPPARLNDPAGNDTEAEGSAALEAASDSIAVAGTVPRIALYAPGGESADAIYTGLIEISASKRAQRLASLLHWDRVTREAEAIPMSLGDCLDATPPARRRQVVAAFWQVRQYAAARQVLVEQRNWLEALAPVALELRAEPGGSLAMLRLRAARLKAEADLLDVENSLAEAEFELTNQLGQPLDRDWISADTVPHGGGYNLKLDKMPQQLVNTPAVRRLAETIPGLHVVLQDQAAAIVSHDLARSTALAAYRQGREPIDGLLNSMDAQRDETLRFLETLTQYNRSIADYVLAVVRPDVSLDVLVPALVLSPTGRSPREALPDASDRNG